MEKKIALYGPGGDSGTVRQEIVPLHMCLALQASPRLAHLSPTPTQKNRKQKTKQKKPTLLISEIRSYLYLE